MNLYVSLPFVNDDPAFIVAVGAVNRTGRFALAPGGPHITHRKMHAMGTGFVALLKAAHTVATVAANSLAARGAAIFNLDRHG